MPSTKSPRSRRRERYISLLNVADNSLRHFLEEYDRFFMRYWESRVGEEVNVLQSHDTSDRHVRSVIEGVQADVVSLSTEEDIETIRARRGLLGADWQGRLPRRSVPFRARLALVIRKGNPKQIQTWGDLMREDVQVATASQSDSDPLAPLRAAAGEGADASRRTDVVMRLARTIPPANATWRWRRSATR